MYPFRYWPVVILLWLSNYAMAQPTFSDQKQRIISICNWQYYSNDVAEKDTIHFSYSGNRGSAFDALDFDASDGATFGYGFASYSIYQWYSQFAADMPEPVKDLYSSHVAYDTMRRFHITYHMQQPGGATIGGVSTMVYRDSFPVVMNDGVNNALIEYDTYGRPLSVVIDNKNTAGTSDFFRQVVYDGANKKILTDTFTNIREARSLVYAYDNNDRVTQITERRYTDTGIDSFRYVYDYNAQGKLYRLTSLTFVGLHGQWDTIVVQDIHYDNNGRIISIYGNGNVMLEAHYNANGETDSLVRYVHNDWTAGGIEYCKKTVFFYNTYHNPDSAITFSFDSCGANVSFICRTYYHYDTYFADTLLNRKEVVLFPNPAHNEIYIKWNKIFSTIPVDIVIYNSAGQVMSKTNIAKPAYTDTIHIAGYAPGVYFLRIKNVEGKQLYIGRFVIDQ